MNFKNTLILIITTLILLGCAVNGNKSKLTADEKLSQVIADEQAFRRSSNPFNDTTIKGNNAKLPDLSEPTLKNHHQKISQFYQRLNNINEQNLSTANKINWAVLRYNLKNEIDSFNNKEYYMPLTAESGFHVDISFIGQQVNFKSVQDYQDYLARLKAIPTYFAQQMHWMQQGIKEGITQPKVVLQGFEQSIKAYIKANVEESVYFQPFVNMPSYIASSTQNNLKQAAKLAIQQYVFPAYQQYYDFMVQTYIPNARNTIAASALPNGQHYYQNRVEHYTTLTMSADEIHQLGLQEVARIKGEMDAIIKQVQFKGSFADFIEFLRTDEQFYAKTPEQLLKEASYIAKQMDGKLPSLFKTLPRNPYTVAPVPANIAPKYTTGRYSPPSRDDQAGSYWVNTYRLDRRPLYVLEALTFHEAVPGHHLQGAIAREMNNVPEFRNNTYISAFGEGWGLYSEYLGVEAGFYQSPYSKFGRLTYEMWRACRLVVDTGMHSKGWSRKKAMDYLSSHTALSLHNVQTEIDRYISWPGQALSYKMGELTIKAIRKKAENHLGEYFDLRDFHDHILMNGSMPLKTLQKVMDDYIKQEENKLKQAAHAK